MIDVQIEEIQKHCKTVLWHYFYSQATSVLNKALWTEYDCNIYLANNRESEYERV